MLSDEQIDALLDSDDSGNALNIHARIQERRRKRAHATAKAAQPKVGLKAHAVDTIIAEIRKPLTEDDRDPGGLDQLCLTVQDCIDAGDIEDVIFALIRQFRKTWAFQRHLEPIDARVKVENRQE